MVEEQQREWSGYLVRRDNDHPPTQGNPCRMPERHRENRPIRRGARNNWANNQEGRRAPVGCDRESPQPPVQGLEERVHPDHGFQVAWDVACIYGGLHSHTHTDNLN